MDQVFFVSRHENAYAPARVHWGRLSIAPKRPAKEAAAAGFVIGIYIAVPTRPEKGGKKRKWGGTSLSGRKAKSREVRRGRDIPVASSLRPLCDSEGCGEGVVADPGTSEVASL